MAVLVEKLVEFVLGDVELKSAFFLLAGNDFGKDFWSEVDCGIWFEAGFCKGLPNTARQRHSR